MHSEHRSKPVATNAKGILWTMTAVNWVNVDAGKASGADYFWKGFWVGVPDTCCLCGLCGLCGGRAFWYSSSSERIGVPSWAPDTLMPSLWLVKAYDCGETGVPLQTPFSLQSAVAVLQKILWNACGKQDVTRCMRSMRSMREQGILNSSSSERVGVPSWTPTPLCRHCVWCKHMTMRDCGETGAHTV